MHFKIYDAFFQLILINMFRVILVLLQHYTGTCVVLLTLHHN